jgi:hypothetical protein
VRLPIVFVADGLFNPSKACATQIEPTLSQVDTSETVKAGRCVRASGRNADQGVFEALHRQVHLPQLEKQVATVSEDCALNFRPTRLLSQVGRSRRS